MAKKATGKQDTKARAKSGGSATDGMGDAFIMLL